MTTELRSPEIDARRATGVALSFRRWLTVQDATFDQAQVLVNGHVVWQNPTGETTRDADWRNEEIDVSRFADGKRIHVAFALAANGAVNLGGWNVDDVRVTATGARDAGCDVGGGGSPWGGAPIVVVLAMLLWRSRFRTPWPTASSATSSETRSRDS